MHASFALNAASLPVDLSVLSYGDQALPRLPNGGLVRWMGVRGELHKLLATMGYTHGFLYASSGPSLGQWLVAHGAGGRLIAGAVRLTPKGTSSSVSHLRAGQVVELSISRPAALGPELARLRSVLSADHLHAVPSAPLIRDSERV